MFAVKGWAIESSLLKAQTQPFQSSSPKQNEDDKPAGGRKRKRQNPQNPQADDVASLWERHIEGKAKPKINKLDRKKKKKRIGVESRQVGDGPNTESASNEVDLKTVESGKEKKNGLKDAKKRTSEHEPSDPIYPATGNHKVASTDVAQGLSVQAAAKLTPMQSAMQQKLVSARFRHLNQTLYTESSGAAMELFDRNPAMFEDYHAGFRQQVSQWPENPVDSFIATIQLRGKVRSSFKKSNPKGRKRPSGESITETPGRDSLAPLPRTQGTCIIADLGCGDARLAQTLRRYGDEQKLNLKLLSYDLHSPSSSSLVTKADISHVPTADGTVDVAIFCLALMGTNWISFIEEAYRILHWKGELWIAEIKSRFGRVSQSREPVKHSVGGKRKQAAYKKEQQSKEREQEERDALETLEAEVDGVEAKGENTDVAAFVNVLRRRGFVLRHGTDSVNLGNRMFVTMEFIKAETPLKGAQASNRDASSRERFKPKAFLPLANSDEPNTDDETKVLKPCLYKIR